MGFWKTITRKEDPSVYQDKDSHLIRSLRVRDFLALGVGTIVSTSIFTLPGEVAAMHTGPAVAISFVIAAVVAGLVAFAYAEMSAAMPIHGSPSYSANSSAGLPVGHCWLNTLLPWPLSALVFLPTCGHCLPTSVSSCRLHFPMLLVPVAGSLT